MSKTCKHKDWQEKNAKTQQERFTKALNPDGLELMEFSIEQWMEFAYNFAEKVNYFDELNSEVIKGNWENFFIQKSEINSFIKQINNGETTPHLALFVSFLYLLEIPRSSFNKLTKRHLDYYYQNVLQIKRKASVPDQVHVVFELAKNMANALINKTNLLDGGKDTLGKRRIYVPKDQLVVNNAVVTDIKNLNHHFVANHGELTAASVANSVDGLGEALNENQPWHAFGYPSKNDTTLALQKPRLGFLVASEVLRMAEGKRSINLNITFESTIENPPNITEIIDNIKIELSGEKKWIQAHFVVGSSVTSTSLWLKFEISQNEDAVVDINTLLHGYELDNVLPAVSLQIIQDKPKAYSVYQFLNQIKISQITITVNVEAIENLTLSNDQGIINAKKPFYPFGTNPVIKSNFDINYPEVFAKNWSTITLKSKWKNTPIDFVTHYLAYRKEHLNKPLNRSNVSFIERNNYKSYFSSLPVNEQYHHIEEIRFPISENISNNLPKNLIVKNDNHFKANQHIKKQGNFPTSALNEALFIKNQNDYIKNFSFNNTGGSYSSNNSGPLRITLNEPFYHAIYQKIYALAMISETPANIPNEPYTPMMENIEMTYTASALFKNHTHSNGALNFYHVHPFGHSLKLSETQTPQSLIPAISGGELFIGLERAVAGQQISLLFQFDEGTENPLASFYEANKGIVWSVLANNQWLDLDKSTILKNETDNFLKSGLFQFTLPSNATVNNTLLPKGKHWLRAVHSKSYDAACKIRGIHAQGALATFQNNENSLEHLMDTLPAETIAKLVLRLSEIKKMQQPYPSFGGRLEETDEHYYTRVSERLRHKNRAITMWDYEQLVLEQFPKIHQVKCLNHTSKNSFNAPGYTTLVVIPNTANQTIFDMYQPRVSQAMLNEIAAFVNRRNSLHVNAEVINPVYEEIQVHLTVQFRTGFDVDFYSTKLNDDLTKLLSPWAFSEKNAIKFGVKLYRSQVIDAIEKLGYVDFISDFEMFKILDNNIENRIAIVDAVPTNPKTIWVSAKRHFIKKVNTNCSQILNSNTEKQC